MRSKQSKDRYGVGESDWGVPYHHKHPDGKENNNVAAGGDDAGIHEIFDPLEVRSPLSFSSRSPNPKRR